MDGFMQLVKDMRAAQKEYFSLRHRGEQPSTVHDALQRSKALERRVDEEIQRVEGLANNTHVLTDDERRMLFNSHAATQTPDCIRMANGQTLRQGNLFED